MSRCTVVWKGEQVIEEMDDVLFKALDRIAERILFSAKQNAPLETGALRRSGCVTIGLPPNPEEVYGKAQKGSGEDSVLGKPTGSPNDELVMYVTFNTPYAARLHENTDWNPRAYSLHYEGRDPVTGEAEYSVTDSPPVGGPKYLEKAAEEHWKEFPKAVRKIARDKRKR